MKTTTFGKNDRLILFYAIAACSWMQHWDCQYYRLETGTSFAVGRYSFSRFDSYVSLVVFSVLILINVLATVQTPLRFAAALLTGLGLSALGILHIIRLIHPFRFEVFSYQWSLQSSLREVIIVFPFGILCILISLYLPRKSLP